MKYVCRSCEKEFEFDTQLSFCPYCGGSITGKSNITQTIDSIWGETASLKREFTSLMFVALDKIAKLFAESCEQIKEKYLKICLLQRHWQLWRFPQLSASLFQ